MENNKITNMIDEKYIKTIMTEAYADIAPDRLDDIMNRPVAKFDSLEEVMGRDTGNNWWIPVCGTTVAAMLAVTIGMNLADANNYQSAAVSSYVYIDVNPSIEIEVADDGTVLKCSAYNEDAKEIIDNNLVQNSVNKHEKLDIVMKNVMLAIRNEGYFSGQYGSVLFSAAYLNGENEYVTQTIEEVTEYVMAKNFCQNVVSTEVENLDEAMEQAEEYGVSPGKITYITEVAEDISYVGELATKNIDTIVSYENDHSSVKFSVDQVATTSTSEEVTIDHGANYEMMDQQNKKEDKEQDEKDDQKIEEVAGYTES